MTEEEEATPVVGAIASRRLTQAILRASGRISRCGPLIRGPADQRARGTSPVR
jgi:putative component of membrane protein insertase Oxa1/YidC/SpoIIIJ protein YidD